MEVGGFAGIAALIVAVGGLLGIWATRGRDKGTLRMNEYDQLQENLDRAWGRAEALEKRIDELEKKLETALGQLSTEREDNSQLRQDLDRANARIEHLEKQQASDHP